MRGLIDWKTFRRWQKHPNVIERDYQFKRALGFGEDTFTRLAGLLPSRIMQGRTKDAAEAKPGPAVPR